MFSNVRRTSKKAWGGGVPQINILFLCVCVCALADVYCPFKTRAERSNSTISPGISIMNMYSEIIRIPSKLAGDTKYFDI